MIYLIGGLGCSGKTTLAWQLLKSENIPFFSLDYLMMGLHHGAPILDVDPNQPEVVVTPKVWQVSKPMLVAMLENGEEYCVEGFAITPEHAGQLFKLFPDDLRACFLGYCTIDLEEKWRNEERYRQNNTWLLELSEEEAIAELKTMQQQSILLREQCRQTGYPFFDTSQAFTQAIEQAARYLITSSIDAE